MIVNVNNRLFETKYFPFFRIEQTEDFDIYTITYPSGFQEEMVVFDQKDYMNCLKCHMGFLISEYALEEDDMLTPRAMKLKNDILDMIEERSDNAKRI